MKKSENFSLSLENALEKEITQGELVFSLEGIYLISSLKKIKNISYPKEDADVLDDNGLPISGKKSDLIELIAKNDSVMEGVFSICKENSGIEEIKDCCEELGIKSDGVRKDLETRIEDYLFKKEKYVSNNIESKINDRKKRNVLKNKKVNYDYA